MTLLFFFTPPKVSDYLILTFLFLSFFFFKWELLFSVTRRNAKSLLVYTLAQVLPLIFESLVHCQDSNYSLALRHFHIILWRHFLCFIIIVYSFGYRYLNSRSNSILLFHGRSALLNLYFPFFILIFLI